MQDASAEPRKLPARRIVPGAILISCGAVVLGLSLFGHTGNRLLTAGAGELGLLRAVGMTRGQLRSAVRLESLIISLPGAFEGLVLGIVFGWAIVAALRPQGITHLVFPVAQLLAVAAAAGLAGL